jgi:hypothetical protein
VRLQTKDDERARFGRRYYTKSGVVKRLERDLIDVVIAAFESSQASQPRVAMPAHGGAIWRVPRDATALWHRDVLHSVILQTSSDDSSLDERNVGWVKARWPEVEPYTSGVYANVNVMDAKGDPARMAFGGNYERLATLKNRYDPTNLFRLNANVRPRP